MRATTARWSIVSVAVVVLFAGGCGGATVADAAGGTAPERIEAGEPPTPTGAGTVAVPAYPGTTEPGAAGAPGSSRPDFPTSTLAPTTAPPHAGTGAVSTTTLVRGVSATIVWPFPSIAPGAGIGTGGSIIPPAGPGSIEGRVTDATSGAPLPNVRVWLLTRDSQLAGSTVTGADGRYQFSSIARGEYRVSVRDETAARGSVFYPDAPDAEQGTVLAVDGKVLKADARLYLTAEQPIPSYSGTPTGRRIAVIGDSLVQTGTSSILRALLPLGLVSVRGLNAKRVGELQPVAARYGATHPTTVVIALGTNDVDQQWPLDATIADLRTMTETFPTACIVVVNVNTRTPNPAFNGRAALLNAAIAELVAARPNTHVADWATRSAELQSISVASRWFTDGIHLTAEGRAEYAALMLAGARSCA